MEDIAELVLRVRPQFLEDGLGLLLLVVTVLKGVLKAHLLLHALIVLTHLVIHLLYHVLTRGIRGCLGLVSLKLQEHFLFVLLVDLTDLRL